MKRMSEKLHPCLGTAIIINSSRGQLWTNWDSILNTSSVDGRQNFVAKVSVMLGIVLITTIIAHHLLAYN